MGPDPVTEKPMVIKEGRFGPYVTDGEYNASLRRGQTPEELTVEQASEMLADKRAKGPAPKKKAAAKKAAKSADGTAKRRRRRRHRPRRLPRRRRPAKKAAGQEGHRRRRRRRPAKKAAPAKATASAE